MKKINRCNNCVNSNGCEFKNIYLARLEFYEFCESSYETLERLNCKMFKKAPVRKPHKSKKNN